MKRAYFSIKLLEAVSKSIVAAVCDRRAGKNREKRRSQSAATAPRRILKPVLTILGLLGLSFIFPTQGLSQFNFETNNGTLTLVGYSGSEAVVVVPSSVNGLPVTSIGDAVFVERTNLTSCVIPTGITNIGVMAFYLCTSLTNIDLPESLKSIEDGAFSYCSSLAQMRIPQNVGLIGGSAFELCESLTNLTLPDRLTSIAAHTFSNCTNLSNLVIPPLVADIGDFAFANCWSLTKVIVPSQTTNLGAFAFGWCDRLEAVFFRGDAPVVGDSVFYAHDPFRTLNAHYLPGTSGWNSTLGGRPTLPWFLPNPLILNNSTSFGIKTNRFGFAISWATNGSVVVEASVSPTGSEWQAVGTNLLLGGTVYFSDPHAMSYPSRFYRVRSQ